MQNEDLEVKEEVDSNLEATIEEANEDVESSNDNSTNNVEELKSKYDASIKEIDELNNRLLRLQADFNNYKKRSEKEKESIVAYAAEGLVTGILPILDNFDRALDLECDESSKAFYEGIQMVHNQLLEILNKNGLEEIDCLNQKFDYNCHQAISQQESSEHEEDTVIQVLGKGYKFKDKVVRPSMVIVSK